MRRFSITRNDWWKVVGVSVILLGVFTFAMAQLLPYAQDWNLTFRPAALTLVSGKSPYTDASLKDLFFHAPWALLPLIPIALLPEGWGRGLLFVVSFVAFAIAAIRLGARPVACIAFLLSPPVVHSLLNGNLDWMPLLGFILPPPIGLFFLAVKPQMGSIVAMFWLIEAWRKGGLREIVRVFGPLTCAVILSLFVFGLWPLNTFDYAVNTPRYNASLWPLTIPVGLALAIASVRLRHMKYAMAASPCLSPYVLLHSWSGALAAIVGSTQETVAAVVGLWIVIVIQAFSGAL